MTTKEKVRKLLDGLPDDCSIEDVLYHLYVIQSIDRGLADIEAGKRSLMRKLQSNSGGNGFWAPPGSLE